MAANDTNKSGQTPPPATEPVDKAPGNEQTDGAVEQDGANGQQQPDSTWYSVLAVIASQKERH